MTLLGPQLVAGPSRLAGAKRTSKPSWSATEAEEAAFCSRWEFQTMATSRTWRWQIVAVPSCAVLVDNLKEVW